MFKDIAGFEGIYGITSCGRVWSYRSKKFLKLKREKNGYWRVCLYKNGEQKNFYLHRLVAEAYIPNPQGLDTVDHIDGCKDHNYVNNLQWMSVADNTRKGNNKPVYCVELDRNFISAKEAARQLGLCHGNICSCCRGERYTCGGYHWNYVEEGLV